MIRDAVTAPVVSQFVMEPVAPTPITTTTNANATKTTTSSLKITGAALISAIVAGMTTTLKLSTELQELRVEVNVKSKSSIRIFIPKTAEIFEEIMIADVKIADPEVAYDAHLATLYAQHAVWQLGRLISGAADLKTVTDMLQKSLQAIIMPAPASKPPGS